jgi:hypothetical protein
VVDWRGALDRMRRSSVGGVLMPMVDRMAPGQRLLLVTPTKLPSSPLYLELINKDTNRWSRALYHDPALKLLAVYNAASGHSGLPVRAALYVKR